MPSFSEEYRDAIEQAPKCRGCNNPHDLCICDELDYYDEETEELVASETDF